ncbi:MAG: helix-turn-helix domain-containing protein [Phycisphaerales bacterium]
MAKPPEQSPGSTSAPVRTRRTQKQRRETSRAAILAAAREAFMDRGFDAVSLQEIVKGAGMTRGALYHQFSDKAAVLRAVVQEEAARMQAHLRDGLAGIADPIERLKRGFGVYLDGLDDLRVIRLMHVEYPAHCGAARSTLDSPWLRYAEDLVATAIADGLMPSVPKQAMARLVLAFSREALVAIAYAEDPAATRRDMQAALDALYDGMRRDPRG